jgi:beta-lactamase class A
MLPRFSVRTLLGLLFIAVGTATTNALDSSQLETQVRNITGPLGNVGVGVQVVETSEQWFFKGSERFPMQSTYKAPIAVAVLHQVDQGVLTLDQPIVIHRADLSVGWSPINKSFQGEAMPFTIQELLQRMVGESDNTAADVLQRTLGGPKNVQQILDGLGIKDVRIDRLEREIQLEMRGLDAKDFQSDWSDNEVLQQALSQLPESARRTALQHYFDDPRDTATPIGMCDFLVKLQTNRLLSEKSTQLLLKIMTESTTGQKRLKAGLPAGWSVAHKTGTSGDLLRVWPATNDVGILSTPQDEHIAIAVFIANSPASFEDIERATAQIAAAVAKAFEERKKTSSAR